MDLMQQHSHVDSLNTSFGVIQHPISIQHLLHYLSKGISHIPLSVVNAMIAKADGRGRVSDFVYQLIKMLAENKFPEVISWERQHSSGRICVHDPPRLAKEVLCKYFRHNNFSSFQRQLHYFGFRKCAGKSKMSPCSYYHGETTPELQSLFFLSKKNKKHALSDAVSMKKKMISTTSKSNSDESKSNIMHNKIIQPLLTTSMLTTDAPTVLTPQNLPEESPSSSPSFYQIQSDSVPNPLRHCNPKANVETVVSGGVGVGTQHDLDKFHFSPPTEDDLLLADIFGDKSKNFSLMMQEIESTINNFE